MILPHACYFTLLGILISHLRNCTDRCGRSLSDCGPSDSLWSLVTLELRVIDCIVLHLAIAELQVTLQEIYAIIQV
jgi:hypothetical protein